MARAALALDVSNGGDPRSPFEESVIRHHPFLGYDITPQVGTAGYRIDIGVRHPEYPGSYALGVECDGYQYHSAKAARDRDRLREQVLIGLGWRLHRIWGTAWYRDRSGEEHRLRTAIEQAILAPVMGVLGDADAPRADRAWSLKPRPPPSTQPQHGPFRMSRRPCPHCRTGSIHRSKVAAST